MTLDLRLSAILEMLDVYCNLKYWKARICPPGNLLANGMRARASSHKLLVSVQFLGNWQPRFNLLSPKLFGNTDMMIICFLC